MDIKRFETGAVRSRDADMVRFDLITPIGLRRLAETYAEGAAKYGANNWLKGIPSSDLFNHAVRHMYMWLSGDTSEDHLAHAAWNIFAIMHFEETRPELIDCGDEGCAAQPAEQNNQKKQQDANQDSLLLIDMDGVLVDFVGGLARQFGLGESTRGYICRVFGTKKKCPWYLTELFPALTLEQILEAMTPTFWARLRPMPWFDKLKEELLTGRYGKPYICTSAGSIRYVDLSCFANAAAGKAQWIKERLPSMGDSVIIAFDKSPLVRGNILIDDCGRNVRGCAKGILFPAPWNDNYEIFWEGNDSVCDYVFERLRSIA